MKDMVLVEAVAYFRASMNTHDACNKHLEYLDELWGLWGLDELVGVVAAYADKEGDDQDGHYHP